MGLQATLVRPLCSARGDEPSSRNPYGGRVGRPSTQARASGYREGARCVHKLGPRLAVYRLWDMKDPAHGSKLKRAASLLASNRKII